MSSVRGEGANNAIVDVLDLVENLDLRTENPAYVSLAMILNHADLFASKCIFIGQSGGFPGGLRE